MARPVFWLIPFCLFVSFLLLLLVSLSLPVIKTLYILQVQSAPVSKLQIANVAADLRFGVWGVCATSELDAATHVTKSAVCTHPRLGYDLDSKVLALIGHPQIASIVEKTLAVVLVLNPIAAALTFLALLCTIPAARVHACGIFALLLTILSALMTTIALGVVFGIIGVAKSRVGPLTDDLFSVSTGNCPWMVLTAMILLWIAVVLASAVSCNCCGLGRRRSRNERYAEK
ncbi:hypothetical protein M422DRAFT_234667 [Sphaerobolus stellatus SS14]|uniref:Unplaced genomic scaffold SPHSTscaffold_170, whole genome shotgun sequence n=1 Tax=Sphaerobolus stellatus (strain SS14) TaxID=990650 RepID=A0A0C9TMT0_SPHS4|nr:hypothetical protein M422DRAFT_234667 [Sphaerobolus stellatus SS14]